MVRPQFRVRTNEKMKVRDRPVLEVNQLGLAGLPGLVAGPCPAANPFRLLGLSFGVVDRGNG